MIDIIDSSDKLLRIRSEWERLETNPQLRLPQTFWWCYYGWQEILSKNEANRLWVLKWRNDTTGDCVVFPFYIDEKDCLRFILDQRNDVCDCVYLEGVNRHWCYKEAADLILKNASVKSVDLRKVAIESDILRYFAAFIPGPLVYKDNAYSWISVQKSADFFISQKQLKSKDRADLRAIWRKAQRKQVRTYSRQTGEDFPEKTILDLRQQMKASGHRGDGFMADNTIRFVREIYEKGLVEIVTILDGEKTVGLNFLQRKGERRLSWIFLYTDNRASTEMYVNYLCKEASREDFLFDFGVGIYSYKIGTFRPEIGLTSALLYGKSPMCHLKCAIRMNIRLAKDYLKHLLKKEHI